MDINKATNEELLKEQERLNGIFEKCKENLQMIYDTMEKASKNYNEISDILTKRGHGNKREEQE